MNIGIFSDIHNQSRHLQAAMALMRELRCGHFFFLGDCTTAATWLETLDLAADTPLDAVAGNNDFDLHTFRHLADNATAARFFEEPTAVTRYGVRFFLSHYPQPAMRAARQSEVDVALYGHTHRAATEYVGHVLLANPGELQGRTGTVGFAVYDTDTHCFTCHRL